MTKPAADTVFLPSGAAMPRLGLGTWRMAERPSMREAEIAALRAGLDRGLGLIDTAEMYANGEAERENDTYFVEIQNEVGPDRTTRNHL